jgi:hypothetical protein
VITAKSPPSRTGTGILTLLFFLLLNLNSPLIKLIKKSYGIFSCSETGVRTKNQKRALNPHRDIMDYYRSDNRSRCHLHPSPSHYSSARLTALLHRVVSYQQIPIGVCTHFAVSAMTRCRVSYTVYCHRTANGSVLAFNYGTYKHPTRMTIDAMVLYL